MRTTGPLDVAPLVDLGGYGGVARAGRPPAFTPNARRRRGRLLRRPGRPQVSVDNNRCRLYAICQMEAPASFLVARDGRLYYDTAPATTELTRVRQAARLCPMQAIALRAEPR
ncbi:ferredoxin [Frankia sp. R82]|uniref:ferredoxin n=1 Tax=Frankia sp. R82 TaxID=2950553 RepID=UPI0020437E8C|nr:ferredoxin [Frankia sp. R82]MCM3882572.1 ferredoxin [Frankia sp. R82]